MKNKYELLAPVGDSRKILSFEVVGGRSHSLVGGRFEVEQRGCQFLRLVQLKGGLYEK